jgi:hypothetical protein
MVSVDERRAQAAIDREAIGKSDGQQRRTPAKRTPKPMAQEAYHGVVGEIVERVAPHTESSREALLVDALAQLGNCMDRGPHGFASGSRHGVNDFFVLVGPSGSGRKGGSHGHTRRLMGDVDPQWAAKCIKGGLSSGEGIVHHVRDAREKNGEVVDPGVLDKRLLCYEPEYGSVLTVMQRRGSTLSTQMRQAWDVGDLGVLTKHLSERATDVHFSLLAHITNLELQAMMSDLQAANGYGNRHLFFWVERRQYLPDGGGLPSFDSLAPRLSDVVNKAGRLHLYERDGDAKAVWAEVYPELTADRPGITGAITARGEAHALRLQILYAALDGSEVIRPEHVFAALEVVRYAHDTARFIFGNKTGNKDADRILESLIAEGPKPRSELFFIFKNNIPAARLQTALDLLVEYRLAWSEQREPEEGGHKPIEVWTATDW